ncbi:MAG: hypothetical protein OXR68_03585 [Alphaproteobacteria bacterium]|nr:hypothetical protein [Alphaproteobacteria bacterium]MDD9919689.1 hypothetical protein [Alphaproteobacteria bacterium]
MSQSIEKKQSIWTQHSSAINTAAMGWLCMVALVWLFTTDVEVYLGLASEETSSGWRWGYKLISVLSLAALGIIIFNTIAIKIIMEVVEYTTNLWKDEGRRLMLFMTASSLAIAGMEIIAAARGGYEFGINGYWRPLVLVSYMFIVAGISLHYAGESVTKTLMEDPNASWGRLIGRIFPFLLSYFGLMGVFSIPFTYIFVDKIFLKNVTQDVILWSNASFFGFFTFDLTLKMLFAKFISIAIGFLAFFILILGSKTIVAKKMLEEKQSESDVQEPSAPVKTENKTDKPKSKDEGKRRVELLRNGFPRLPKQLFDRFTAEQKQAYLERGEFPNVNDLKKFIPPYIKKDASFSKIRFVDNDNVVEMPKQVAAE